MQKTFYEKVGRRYVPVGIEFCGWPADGVWLVANGRSSLIMKVGDLIDPMPLSAMLRFDTDACKAVRELRSPYSCQDIVETVCRAICQASETVHRKKKE
jgi:hypothetical protein